MGLFSKMLIKKANKKKEEELKNLKITPEYVASVRGDLEAQFGEHTKIEEVELGEYLIPTEDKKYILVSKTKYIEYIEESKDAHIQQLGWNEVVSNIDNFVNESTKTMIRDCIRFMNFDNPCDAVRPIAKGNIFSEEEALLIMYKNPLYFILNSSQGSFRIPLRMINKNVINTIELFLGGKNSLNCSPRQSCKDNITLTLMAYNQIYCTRSRTRVFMDSESYTRFKDIIEQMDQYLQDCLRKYNTVKYEVIDVVRHTNFASLLNQCVTHNITDTDIILIQDALFDCSIDYNGYSNGNFEATLTNLKYLCNKTAAQIICTSIPNVETNLDCARLQRAFGTYPIFETNWGIDMNANIHQVDGIDIHICNENNPYQYGPDYIMNMARVLLYPIGDKNEDEIIKEMYSGETKNEPIIVRTRNEIVADLKLYMGSYSIFFIHDQNIRDFGDPNDFPLYDYDFVYKEDTWLDDWKAENRAFKNVSCYSDRFVSDASVINFTDGDMDGAGAAIMFKLAYGDDVNIIETYRNIDSVFLEFIDGDDWIKYRKIYLTDVSISESVYKRCKEIDTKYNGQLFEKLHIWDHHSQATWLNKLQPGFKIETEDWKDPEHPTSGTLLAYRMLVSKIHTNATKQGWLNGDGTFSALEDIIGEFAKIIRDYDTWEWFRNNDANPKKLNDFFLISGWEVFVDEFFKKAVTCLNSRGKMKMTSNQLFVVNRHQMMVDKLIETKDRELIPVEIDGHKAGFIFLDSNHSEVGNVLAGRHPEFDFIAMFTGSRFSFRSKTMDVSELAFKHGGGGNGFTAGAPIPQIATDDIAQSIMNCLAYQDRNK